MSGVISAILKERAKRLPPTNWSQIFASGTLATKTLHPLKTLVDGVVTPAVEDDVMAITRDVAREP